MSVSAQKMSKPVNSGLARDLLVELTKDQVANQENLGKALAKINTIIDSSHENVQTLKESIQAHAQFIEFLTNQDEDSEHKFKGFIATQYKLIEELKKANEEQQTRDVKHIKELEKQLKDTIEMYEKYNKEKNLQDKVGYMFALVMTSTTALAVGLAVVLSGGGAVAGVSAGAQVAGQLTTPLLLTGRTFFRYIHSAYQWCGGSKSKDKAKDKTTVDAGSKQIPSLDDSHSDSINLDILSPVSTTEKIAGQKQDNGQIQNDLEKKIETELSRSSLKDLDNKSDKELCLSPGSSKESDKKSDKDLCLSPGSSISSSSSQKQLGLSEEHEQPKGDSDTKKKKEKRNARASLISTAQLQTLAVRANQKNLKQEITLFQKDLKSTIDDIETLAISTAENALLLKEYLSKQTEHLNALRAKFSQNAIDKEAFLKEQNRILAETRAEAERINKQNQDKIEKLKAHVEIINKKQHELTKNRTLKDSVGYNFALFASTITASFVGGFVYKATADSLNAFLNALAASNYVSTPSIVIGRVFYKGIAKVSAFPSWCYNLCFSSCSNRNKVKKYETPENTIAKDVPIVQPVPAVIIAIASGDARATPSEKSETNAVQDVQSQQGDVKKEAEIAAESNAVVEVLLSQDSLGTQNVSHNTLGHDVTMGHSGLDLSVAKDIPVVQALPVVKALPVVQILPVAQTFPAVQVPNYIPENDSGTSALIFSVKSKSNGTQKKNARAKGKVQVGKHS